MAVKDFDQGLETDLEFKLRGEAFKMRYVRPEVLSAWEDETLEGSSEDALKKIDERILLFLDQNGDTAKRWKTLREREDNPVSMGQLNSLLMWMIEVQSGRPTSPPSPSVSGRGKTAVSSKAE